MDWFIELNYLSKAMATIMKIEPVMAIFCPGYNKYGNNMICKLVAQPKFNLKEK